ncbi:MAG TPA: ATP-dependent RecD-like DNA helicase [Thermoanaerobaculia bacterium]|jgi:exodeoxyribonuclease V alpha subunit
MSLPFETRKGPDSAATLHGVLERVVFVNEENAWSVVRLAVPGEREPVTAVGNLLGVQPGENLRLEGQWIVDPKYGRQFKIASYSIVAPSTREGIQRYLSSGMVRGVGKEMAKRLVARFGLETLAVIEREPERLKEVSGIGPKRRAEIQRAFLEQREAREVMVFLQSHGVATGHAIKICKRYGEDALRQVREDPYRLAIDIHGIGFKSADRIAGALGFAKTAPQRVEAGVLHVLGEAADRGHVFLPGPRLTEEAARLLEIPAAPVAAAVEALARAEQIVVEPLPAPSGSPAEGTDRAREAIYLKPLHAAETGLAARLRALLAQAALPLQIDAERAVAWFERKEGVTLAPAQREAVRQGLTSKLLVVTGGPGTGKTTLVRGIVRILEKKGRTIALAAPTGRAAKRLSEATGMPAATIHRLLEFDPRSRRFLRDRERPLACDLLIVDEASMLDTVLAYHLLKAIPNGGRLILVGDVDQLPSVGPGRVLADLIRSRAVGVAELDFIFRQGERSQIVANAHRIRRGELPVVPRDEASDFFIADRGRPEEVLETLIDLVTRRIPARFGLDPFEEIQVLSPMSRGLLGTANLNQVLRDVLNPRGTTVAHGLRLGDKVMQVRNDYELEVWNGDLGRVTGVDSEGERLEVAVDGRRILYDFVNLDELVLAYACTIHKSQGSEYPCVVVPVHTQHHVMLQRNLLYTAITRARRLAVLVGERRAVAVAVGNGRTGTRFTGLAERLAAR